MKALKIALLVCILSAGSASAQTYNFIFDAKAKTNISKSADGNTVSITPADTYQKGKTYGYDFAEATGKAEAGKPFFFSVDVPDGNYKVTVALGARKAKGTTTVRAESRRLFLENVPTKKGEFKTYSFVVNKRNTKIGENDRVKIKKREENKLNWDDKLTIEINGDAPACAAIRIEPASQDVPTVWLCGNSTVVDQDYEPWASWGQMIPRWFDDQVCFANYAESGESASTFIAANRLKKILSLMKSGDYIFVEFGHNDQKQKFAGAGAYYNFATCLKTFIDEARKRGADGNLLCGCSCGSRHCACRRGSAAADDDVCTLCRYGVVFRCRTCTISVPKHHRFCYAELWRGGSIDANTSYILRA